ncbi:hypothetical protein [Mycobacterium lepromatosis]|uniref:hypothetical protein n=1 Tax=Mycobacterium lepromatosis TaxID=480418 RepID=UPI000AD4174B|nr:hypothetical protein [Mycobacterium lepromatosis]
MAGVKRLTQGMLHATPEAIVRKTGSTNLGDVLLPDVRNLCAIAAAVYDAAVEDGVVTRIHADVAQAICDARG